MKLSCVFAVALACSAQTVVDLGQLTGHRMPAVAEDVQAYILVVRRGDTKIMPVILDPKIFQIVTEDGVSRLELILPPPELPIVPPEWKRARVVPSPLCADPELFCAEWELPERAWRLDLYRNGLLQFEGEDYDWTPSTRAVKFRPASSAASWNIVQAKYQPAP